MPRVFDCFPFFGEIHLAYLRMKELAPLVDKFIIQESMFTFGGERRQPSSFKDLEILEEFSKKIEYFCYVNDSGPICYDRTSFRLREAFQRNLMANLLAQQKPQDSDIIIFSDCDEIPSAEAVNRYLKSESMQRVGIHRLKQLSYYYNVNCLVDYGNDFASRARIGTWKNLGEAGSLYAFRMFGRSQGNCPAIEDGGWHFSYFGGMEKIKVKVAAMAGGLQEYKLFGDDQLLQDILNRKDLHHRKSEMPETFTWQKSDHPALPMYLLDHPEEFPTFFETHFKNLRVHQ